MLRPIKVHNYNQTGKGKLVMENTGKSLKISLPSTMNISGLYHSYSAAQLHLHWGSEAKPFGSEHTVNGTQHAAELHIVHYNSERYPNITMAFDKSDGLAVLGVFIQIGAFNPAYDKFIKHLSKIKYKDTKTKISAFNIRELMPSNLKDFYRYDGSLTVPPCYPSVLWTVFRNHVTISKAQYKTLTTALFATGAKEKKAVPLTGNYRNPVPLEHRDVLTSFRDGVFHTKYALCGLLRRKFVKNLLTVDLDDVLDIAHLLPNSTRLILEQEVAAQMKTQNKRPSTSSKIQDLAKPALAFGTLLVQKAAEVKQSTVPMDVPTALAKELLPQLNLRSYLACKADIAPETIKYLLTGGPIDVDGNQALMLDPTISGGNNLYSWLFPVWQD
ncbi:carbonic anhydrase 12 isoform X2 [Dunckerocampus dactyliophorus]|nr:carbonic anhydrase 12 isoform X2 [Dunckerocampus dactyliophorus]XP_054633423.1 carbonic anhydrase 12 isoform X2 [Dunckerocampus dactyliophorus]